VQRKVKRSREQFSTIVGTLLVFGAYIYKFSGVKPGYGSLPIVKRSSNNLHYNLRGGDYR